MESRPAVCFWFCMKCVLLGKRKPQNRLMLWDFGSGWQYSLLMERNRPYLVSTLHQCILVRLRVAWGLSGADDLSHVSKG